MKKVAAVILGLFTWCLFCFAQEYFINIEDESYIMLYGYMAGTIAVLVFDGLWGNKGNHHERKV